MKIQRFYLETLDLNATLAKGNQLKENRARIKAEEGRKAVEKLTVLPPELRGKLKAEKESDLSPKGPLIKAADDPIATFRLEVTAPVSKLKALRMFIDTNGITYKKI